jgi:hypothetical protein
MTDPIYMKLVESIAEDPSVKETLTQKEIAALKELLLGKKLPKKEALLASLSAAQINED